MREERIVLRTSERFAQGLSFLHKESKKVIDFIQQKSNVTKSLLISVIK